MLTVRELTELPVAGTRLIAGRTGAERSIKSAHVCEMEEPWRWLAKGDLLLSTGHGFPSSPSEQVRLVERLDGSGMSGLAVARGRDVPAFTRELRRTADCLGFPVLQTDWDVPFSALSRLITDNAHSEVHDRLERVLHVYERYQAAMARSPKVTRLVDVVSAQLRIPFELIESGTGCPLLTARKADYARARLLQDALRPREGSSIRSMRRVDLDDGECFAIPVSPDAVAALLVRADEPNLDLVSLQHLTALFAVEVRRFCDNREADRRDTESVLRRLMDHTVDVEHARQFLAERQLGQPPWRVAAVADNQASQLTIALDCAGVPHAALPSPDGVVLVLATATDLDAAGRRDEDLRGVAMSNAFWCLSSFGAAAKEATWARLTGSSCSGAKGAQQASFMPKSVPEAQTLVDSVLGDVIEYDRAHGSALVRSLETFLAANRSWQVASSQLNVHRQTLQYRLSRIRQITGRRLDDIDDLAQMHMALKALRILGATGMSTAPSVEPIDDHRPRKFA